MKSGMSATLPTPAERHRELLEELVDDLFAYMPDAETALVSDAFAFACEHHDGQLRKSGEEYILHPWGVAKVCARLQQPPVVLAAALLHDVVEDTDATSDEIAQRFGDDVRLLVTASRSCRGSSSPPARRRRPRTTAR
jgi:(p)ppGpp synthase/HD superfamily hydrolase